MDEHIMISYNHHNLIAANLAKRINKRLKQNNYKTWVDYEQIKGSIYNAMADGIDKAFVVLMLVTEEYCNNVNTIKECEYATRKGKHIIPIKVNNQIDPANVQGIVGLAIGGILYIDFSKSDFDDSMKQLLDQIKKFEHHENAMTTKSIKHKKKNSSTTPSPPLPQPPSSSLNNYKKPNWNCIKTNLMNNKKQTFAIASFLIIIFALVIVIIIISTTNNRSTVKPIKPLQIDVKDIDPGQDEFRYSLKISNNESVVYTGSKSWNYIKNGNTIESYQELSRDNEGVIVKLNNGTFRLSSLSVTSVDPQPRWKKARWNNVWRKTELYEYIYPEFASTWIEVHNDIFDTVHKLLNIDVNGDSYDLYRKDIDFYFRINSSGLYGEDISTQTFFYSYKGSWIYKF